MDYTEFHVKILTQEGDLAVTYYNGDTTLTNKISGVSQGDIKPEHQAFAVCSGCSEDE